MKAIDIQDLKQIISSLTGLPAAEIKEDHTLIQDLSLDSLKFVELMAIMNEEYGVSIQEEEAVNLQTLGHIYTFIKEAQIQQQLKK